MNDYECILSLQKYYLLKLKGWNYETLRMIVKSITQKVPRIASLIDYAIFSLERNGVEHLFRASYRHL